MDKPEDVPQDVWDTAATCVPVYVKREIVERIARAILAAKAEERERTQPIIDWAARQVRKPYTIALALDKEARVRSNADVNSAHKSENQVA